MPTLYVIVLILLAILLLMRYLLKVDSRFPILLSIIFLIASAIFYSWDPNDWAILAFYSFLTGLVIIAVDRIKGADKEEKSKESVAIPFFGKLDKVKNMRKKLKKSQR